MTSKIKTQKIFALPILILLIGLLIPQMPLIATIGITILFLYIEMTKLNRLFLYDTELEVKYPFSIFNKNFHYRINSVEKIIYVNRKKTVRGTYPHSHIVIYFNNKTEKTIKLILNKEELKMLQRRLVNLDVVFEETNKLVVNSV